MPECHNCPHNGRANEACLACKGPPETNHKGKTFVSLDATTEGDGGQSAAMVEAAMLAFGEEPEPDHDDETPSPDGADAPRCGADMPECCEDAARRALAFVLALPNEDLLLLAHRSRGGNMAAFGKVARMSKQAVHIRWARIVRQHPELADVIPGRGVGRPPGHRKGD